MHEKNVINMQIQFLFYFINSNKKPQMLLIVLIKYTQKHKINL